MRPQSHFQSGFPAARVLPSAGVAALLWLSMFVLSPATVIAQDNTALTPPNDICSGALPVMVNMPVTGRLDGTTNNDYQLPAAAGCFTGIGQSAVTAAGRDVVYTFTAPASGDYSFHILSTGGFGNPVVYLATSCPAGPPPQTITTCIGASNRNGLSVAAEEVMCQPLTLNQTVFVFVDDTSSSSTSAFRLEVTACLREREGNDLPQSANLLTCPVEGTINPGGEADFFAFAPTSANDRVFALADGFAGNSADFDMRITTTTDTLEYDDKDATGTFGENSPAIAGTKAVGSSTFVRISQFAGLAAEPYRLYTVLEPSSALATTETDPGGTGNNTIATANIAGSDYFYGTTSTQDTDYFGVCAEKGDVILAALDGDPLYDLTPINGWLTLFDAAGAQLVNVDDSDALSPSRAPAAGLTATAPRAPAEALAWQVDATGLYYVRVQSNTTAPGADYLLAVGLNCLPPGADLSVTKSGAPSPVEQGGTLTYTVVVANDGPTTAQRVTFTDPLPPDLVFLSLSQAGPSPWTCTTPTVGTNGTISCTNSCLPRTATSGSTTFTIVARVDCAAGASIDNVASVAALTPDPNAANNTVLRSTAVLACADSNPCTTDTCTPASGCRHLANSGPCDDGNACTTADICSAGICSGTPLPPPAEVNDSLRVTKSGTTASLAWTDLPGPYNVYKGLRGPAGPWTYNQTCLASLIASPPAFDPPLPTVGGSFYYLVSRTQAGCAESVIGRDSSAAAIPNSSPCP